jgi:hypothetical protein
MAVEFISNKLPSWRAIQTRLKPKEKSQKTLKISIEKVNSRRIGPGFYEFPAVRGKTSTFSSLPRFSPSEKLKILVPNIDRPISERKRFKSSDLIKKTFQKTIHSQIYQSRLKSTSSVSRVKDHLQKAKTEEILKKLNKKAQRIEKWKNNRKFISCQKTWFIFLALCSVSRVFHSKIWIKRRFKTAFKFNSSLLYQMAKCIGKICIRMKEIKKKRSLRVLGNIFAPLFQKRLGKMIERFRRNVVRTLEVYLAKRTLRKLCVAWGRKIAKLEVGLKKMVLIHKARVDQLLDMWNEIQIKYNSYSNKKVFPLDESAKIVRKYLYTKLRSFYVNQTEYRASIRKFKESLKNHLSKKSEVSRRKRGWRLTFALSSLPVLRIFNQDELIRIYLDEEQKTSLKTQELSI